MSSAKVANIALKALLARSPLIVIGRLNAFMAWSTPLMPRTLAAALANQTRESPLALLFADAYHPPSIPGGIPLQLLLVRRFTLTHWRAVLLPSACRF